MPAKNLIRIKDVGTFSHVYNKGIDNRAIFNDPEDFEVFLGFLKGYLNPPQETEKIKKVFNVKGKTFRGLPHQPKNYFGQVELIAYSLTPDRFHLILHQKSEGALERFLRSLSTRYSIYFNKKYKRTGTLFQGPYKSAHVQNDIQLLYLTQYLHKSGTHTSYPEYLGSSEDSLVKPEIILSRFGQGAKDYKLFVEKYQLDDKELELLKKVSIDSEDENLERSLLESRPETTSLSSPSPASKTDNSEANSTTPKYSNKDRQLSRSLPEKSNLERSLLESQTVSQSHLKPHQRIPELFASLVIFLLLTAISITNVSISSAQGSPLPIQLSSVLGLATKVMPNPSFAPKPLMDIEEGPIPQEATPEAKLKQTVTVALEDGASYINIRQKPTTNSEKLGQARDGDTFEFVSIDSGWYGIKLDSGVTGFISAKYVKKGETNN